MVFDCSCIMAVMISVKVLVLAFILIALNGYLINGIQANEGILSDGSFFIQLFKKYR